MKVLDESDVLAVAGGIDFWGIGKTIWYGVMGNFTYDSLKTIVSSVPSPRPLTDAEVARLQEAAERIQSTSPAPGPGREDAGLSGFIQGIPDLLRQPEYEEWSRAGW